MNAGMNGEGLVLFTAAHEMTHMMKDGAPIQWKAYADFIVENYVKRGVDVNGLVLREMNRHPKLRYNDALREVIARASEGMLRDTHLNEKSKKLYKQNRTVWEKIKDAFESIVDRIKKAGYTFAKLQSDEAQLVSKWDTETLEKAQDLWLEGVTVAAKNLRNMKKPADRGGAKLQARGSSSAFNENAVSTAIWEALDHADTGNDNLIKVSSMPQYVESLLGISGDFYVQRNHTYENTVDEEQAKAEGRYDPKAHYHAYGIEKMERALSAIEHPIMTIVAPRTNDGNPTVIMLLDEFGNNDAPMYAVLSFYSNKPVNGKFDFRPHVVLTIAEREWLAEKGRTGYDEIIKSAVEDNRVIDYDKSKRDDLSVIAQTTSLGNITTSSLEHNLSQFKKEINSFKANNKISYQSRDDDLFFDIDFGEDDSVENLIAREFVTHHEDIGEVLKNIAVIDLAPKKVEAIINHIIHNDLVSLYSVIRRNKQIL